MTKEIELPENVLDDSFMKYVLIDAIKSTAQIYVGEKGSERAFRLDTPRKVPLRLQHSFADKNGQRKVTRLKLGATTIFLPDQVKNDSIPANDKFTDEERTSAYVINGVLVTNDTFLKSFFHEDNNPQREEFTGRNRGGETAVIKELDEEALADEENDFIFKTAEAIIKIKGMNKEQASAYVSLFFGASFTIPERLKDCQNLLSKALEGSDEKIDMIINGEVSNPDDRITVLLSKAINKNLISFEVKPNYVQIKLNDAWQDIKMVTGDSYEHREILFREFLASAEGELQRKQIEELVNEIQEENTNDSTPKRKYNKKS